MRMRLVLAGLLFAAPSMARSQIIEGPVGGSSGTPSAFASLSVGWMGMAALCDQESSACWNFGNAPQWRATLEMPMGRGASIGVLGTLARMPLGGFVDVSWLIANALGSSVVDHRRNAS